MALGRPISTSTDALLDAARRAFVIDGYAGAHMSAIAAHAGVTKPTLYARIGGKDALFTATVERDAARLTGHLLARYAQAEGRSARAAIDIAVDALFDFCTSERESFVLLFSTRLGGPAVDRDGLVLERVRAGVATIVAAHPPPTGPLPAGTIQHLAALVVAVAIEGARSAVEREEVAIDRARAMTRAAATALLLGSDPAAWR